MEGSDGGIIWSEQSTCRVQLLTMSNDTITLLAGSSGCGYADGPVSSAKLGNLNGILLGGSSSSPSGSSPSE